MRYQFPYRYWFRSMDGKRIYSCSAYPYQGLNKIHHKTEGHFARSIAVWTEYYARNTRTISIVGVPWGKNWETEKVEVWR